MIEDAPAACDVLRRSIEELCVADHHDDPAILERWLANKTLEIVESWIMKSGNTMLVAVGDGAILGVGSVTDAGEITLIVEDQRYRVPAGTTASFEAGVPHGYHNEGTGPAEMTMAISVPPPR